MRLAALSWGLPLKQAAFERQYTPGEVVPRTGIYKVFHDHHRLMHEATFIEETLFPRCKKCTDAVRFVLVRPIHARYVLPFRSTELLEEWESHSGRAS